MSEHNNSIKLALWETFKIKSSLFKLDVLISMNTETRKLSISLRSISFQYVLFDHCISRLWRVYMFFFNEESNFKNVMNHLEEFSQDDYMRLNILLFADEFSIENISRMIELRELINDKSELMNCCHKTIYALLTTTFYFKLRNLSKKISKDQRQCLKTIRCWLFDEIIIELLRKIYSSSLIFITAIQILKHFENKRNLCFLCRRFRKHVKFTVRDFEQIQTIQIQSSEKFRKKISAFSQSMQWFVQQQDLNVLFETIYHKALIRSFCSWCEEEEIRCSLKRRKSSS